MRIDDIVAMVAEHGARRHFEKRAGMALPFTMGMLAPGLLHGMHERFDHVRDELDAASGQPLDASVAMKSAAFPWQVARDSAHEGTFGTPGKSSGGFGKGIGDLAGAPMSGIARGIGDVAGKGLDRLIFGREYGERKDPMHLMGGAAMGSFGKGLGDMGAELLKDMATKAFAAASHAGDSSARSAIIDQLKHEDPVLMNADDKVLMESYHTMTRFAPVMSTDKNAVRSFLRQAVMSGNGVDFMTIRLIVEAENAVTKDKGR